MLSRHLKIVENKFLQRNWYGLDLNLDDDFDAFTSKSVSQREADYGSPRRLVVNENEPQAAETVPNAE